MLRNIIIITNNPMSKKNFENKHVVEYLETNNSLDVFKKARDYIHKGHKLLTHPLTSSIKPNKTPYRTVVISKYKKSVLDMKSLDVISKSISTTLRFIKISKIPSWNKRILRDFQIIDYDMIANVLY